MKNSLLLPQHPNLSRNPQGEKHTLLQNQTMRLAAWIITGNIWLRKEFLKGLILSSRGEGTNSNYCSSWNKWASWCDKQKVDPFRCILKRVLDFLAELFEQGCQYRSMCSHRPAISVFHEGIDGKSIDEDPQVSSLIMGVDNQRPPQPRYTCIWDVQLLLDYLKKHFLDNKQITDRQLTLKVTILLALTSASRAGGLRNLNI